MWQIVTEENEENNEITIYGNLWLMYFLWPLTFILKRKEIKCICTSQSQFCQY